MVSTIGSCEDKAFFETQQQETQKRHQYFKGAHKIAFHEYPIRNLNQLPSGMGEGTIVMKVLKESDTNKMNSKLNVALLSRHKHKHKFPSHAVSIILALLFSMVLVSRLAADQ